MFDKRKKAHGELVGYSTYLESLVKPWFTTGEFSMEDFKGKVELKIINNMTLAIYVESEADYDLAASILDATFPEEKKDIEIRFFDKTLIFKN